MQAEGLGETFVVNLARHAGLHLGFDRVLVVTQFHEASDLFFVENDVMNQ